MGLRYKYPISTHPAVYCKNHIQLIYRIYEILVFPKIDIFRGRRLPDGGASLRRTVQQDAIEMEKLRGILASARAELYQTSGGGKLNFLLSLYVFLCLVVLSIFHKNYDFTILLQVLFVL